MKREIVSITLMLLLFVSMFLSLPLVSAAYTVEYPYMPPDLEGDVSYPNGFVDMEDVGLVCSHYGLVRGDAGWDPRADVNNDGKVDMKDIGIVSRNYGEEEPDPIAYSTTFEFTVPEDGNKEVWYYILARVYLPQELDGQVFFFVADEVDD